MSQPPADRDRAAQYEIARLRILAEGCRRHPAYRARRRPKPGCPACDEMWQARQELAAQPQAPRTP